jgi:peptidoglycan hydrolase CwlO-like protein
MMEEKKASSVEINQIQPQAINPGLYNIISYKKVTDKTGAEVEILDRQETTSIESLTNQITSLQAQITKLQEKIDSINAYKNK